jgi:hypothetical protein
MASGHSMQKRKNVLDFPHTSARIFTSAENLSVPTLANETHAFTPMYDTYAYFWVRGFAGSPAMVTDELGVHPTESWSAGDPWIPGKPREFGSWHLHSPLPRSEAFMERHLEALLERLEPFADRIHTIRQRFEAGINCVGSYHDEHPGFHISAALISRLHALALDVDFDLYCWSKRPTVVDPRKLH